MRIASPLLCVVSVALWLPVSGCQPPDSAATSDESVTELSVELPEVEITVDEDPASPDEPLSDPDRTVSNSNDNNNDNSNDTLSDGGAAVSKTEDWRDLFDGKTLTKWESTKFGGEGDVHVEDGIIHLGFGQPLTGITYQGQDLPKNNYEIELEAKRVDGLDFFCALTFPVDDSHCSFVVGGWGGSVVGISSIDEMDASENETTDYMTFTDDQWYTIRVRVTPGVLEAWIDGKQLVNVDVAERRLSTRIEVDLSRPLGVCCFDTQAALRNIRIREIAEQ